MGVTWRGVTEQKQCHLSQTQKPESLMGPGECPRDLDITSLQLSSVAPRQSTLEVVGNVADVKVSSPHPGGMKDGNVA